MSDMTDKPPKVEDDTLPEAEADERFRRLVGSLVNTVPKPHDDMKLGQRPKPKARKAT